MESHHIIIIMSVCLHWGPQRLLLEFPPPPPTPNPETPRDPQGPSGIGNLYSPLVPGVGFQQEVVDLCWGDLRSVYHTHKQSCIISWWRYLGS